MIFDKRKDNPMTSKQRAYLKGLAMKINPILQIGKSSITPEFTTAVDEALEARGLIKIHVLKNCFDDPRGMAEIIAERTHSEVVQVIGKKIVLYRESKEKKQIELPKQNRG
jgi:RNA-binding protein